jgi:NAD(P)-dependent dehydrogenase (short-subunit alcohol dehydrogenase family)
MQAKHGFANVKRRKKVHTATALTTRSKVSETKITDPAFGVGNIAVVTGAALGIGRASALRFAHLGMRVAIADLSSDDLNSVHKEITEIVGQENVLTQVCDVSDVSAMENFRDNICKKFGTPSILFNNAVTRVGRGMWADIEDWKRAVDVNLWGVINGVRCFVPAMIEKGMPSRVINAGSKQGITNPPGHPVYNLCKAAVRNLTEGLAYDLRSTPNCQTTAHLLIPGWTTTGKNQHKQGAWMPEQVIDEMLSRVGSGDFYIVCPDGEVSREMDAKRILWSAQDVTENRPALSRWHPDWSEKFRKFELK